MRFASYKTGGRASYGLVTDSGIVDLARRLGDYPTLLALIAADALQQAAQLAGEAADYAPDAVEYLPPIPEPLHFWCLALNYVEHNSEMNEVRAAQDLPKKPALFMRGADSVTGHERPLLSPTASEQHDYEGELAVIIGRRGRNVGEADALSYVAGYTVCNEGSVRDWQFHTKQITPGKNFYHSGAIGPHMVTVDEVADPHNLSIKTWLNDQLVQDGNSRDMLYNINQFIAYVSTITELVPGDVLSTGTPSGVGVARKPPLWMKPGDRCTVEIENVGRLSNPVVANS